MHDNNHFENYKEKAGHQETCNTFITAKYAVFMHVLQISVICYVITQVIKTHRLVAECKQIFVCKYHSLVKSLR